VIAFPLDDSDAELVVSADRAREEAEARGVAPMAELMLYVVHGILHLTGHDDHDEERAGVMHRRSLELLAELGYENRIPREEWGKG
jgi:probable rRNA maturation factor